MDDWTNLMYPLLYSLNPFVWAYFVFVIFIVGFFAFNLIIAIQKTYYSKLVSSNAVLPEIPKNSINLQFIKSIGLYDKLTALRQVSRAEQDSLYHN